MADEEETGVPGAANQKGDDVLFPELSSMSQENYLGNPATLDSLVRTAIDELAEKLSDPEYQNQSTEVRRGISKWLGNILLGKDPAYAPVPKWNVPGAIDVFCATWTGSAETTADSRMEHAVLKMLNEVLDVADYAADPNGVLDEQWEPLMQSILYRYTSLFLGVTPPALAAMSLEEGPDSVEEEKEEPKWDE